VGHIYLASPADPYTFLTKPSNWVAAQQFAEFIPNFLLKVNGASENKVAITVASAKKGTDTPEQDLCNVTVDVRATVSSYPSIQIGPMELPLHVTNSPEGKPSVTAQVTVHEFSLSDVLPNGNAPSEAAKFSALVDARDVVSLINVLKGQPPEAVCTTMQSTFATDCVPCPDSQVLCLLLEAEQFDTSEVEIEVKSTTESDLDPSCPSP
jgi:hypothetical protein